MNEMTLILAVFLAEWLYSWSILLEEDDDANSSTANISCGSACCDNICHSHRDDDERGCNTLIIEKPVPTRMWKCGLFLGYCIHRENSWKWHIYKAVIVGQWAVGFRKVEEFRSLKDAMAVLVIKQKAWLEASSHDSE